MNSSLIAFTIVAFCFALVIILKKESIPAPYKRYLAISALVFVASAFAMIVYSLFTME